MEALTLAAIASAVLNLFQWVYRINIGRLSKQLEDLIEKNRIKHWSEVSGLLEDPMFTDVPSSTRTASGGCKMGDPSQRPQKKCHD